MSRVRNFNPAALHIYQSIKLLVSFGQNSLFEGRVWQFQIFLPRWNITESRGKQEICTANDQDLLEELLEMHFGGYTVNRTLTAGKGRRGPLLEENLHRIITVIASRWRGTIRYFRALRRELEECSGEEQILILRQELEII